MVLITAHRRENLGEPMHRMFRAIRRVLGAHPGVKAVYPIHMNPKARDAAHAELDGFDRLRIIEPLEVVDFHNLMARSFMVFTDSGGIQEEAPSLGKPVLVMRDTTERPEGVGAGMLRLVGTSEEGIASAFAELLDDPPPTSACLTRPTPTATGTRASGLRTCWRGNKGEYLCAGAY